LPEFLYSGHLFNNGNVVNSDLTKTFSLFLKYCDWVMSCAAEECSVFLYPYEIISIVTWVERMCHSHMESLSATDEYYPTQKSTNVSWNSTNFPKFVAADEWKLNDEFRSFRGFHCGKNFRCVFCNCMHFTLNFFSCNFLGILLIAL